MCYRNAAHIRRAPHHICAGRRAHHVREFGVAAAAACAFAASNFALANEGRGHLLRRGSAP